MESHVFKPIEITGSSTESSDDAVRKANVKASQSVKHMDWFDVIERRDYIEQSAVKYWPRTIKTGLRIEDWKSASLVDERPSNRSIEWPELASEVKNIYDAPY